MSGEMRALVWRGPNDVAVEKWPVPQPADGWGLVDVAYGGVCGTDLHICVGEHPRAQPPLLLGHEFVGRLRKSVGGMSAGTPVAVEPLLWCGDCGACRRGDVHVCANLRLLGIDAPGGIAEQAAVPIERLIALPQAVDLQLAAFTEPLAVAVHAVRRASLRIGDEVAVAGAGPIGLAVAQCARIAGAGAVYLSEPSMPRRQVAGRLGTAVLDATDPDGDLAERTGGNGVDVVFDTAAVAPVAASLTRWVRVSGQIVLVGTYSTPTPVDLQSVVFREISMIGSRVYTRQDIERAVNMIASGTFDVSPLVTSVVALDEAPQAIARLKGGSDIKVLISVDEGDS